ncbi:uncharacterized protein LOC108051195 [Drosophila rhopaloa]|uniref:Uncharacterized protein LOC108051195 n=1 Tax=Drosophila rhopaloa TaxID=1041015 RepID=A0A6P4FHF7_DRORH|nr:uncharacterized protein LOC108051195 [Drosophila rhopaloa]
MMIASKSSPRSVGEASSKQTNAHLPQKMSVRINPLVLCLLPLSFLLIAARTRPCIDDRIVFPKDDDEDGSPSKFIYPKMNSTTTTTTTEEPATTITTLLETTNSTEPISAGSEELVNGTTTQKPIIDNRILFETTPKCKEGFELRANRCRKPA